MHGDRCLGINEIVLTQIAVLQPLSIANRYDSRFPLKGGPRLRIRAGASDVPQLDDQVERRSTMNAWPG